MEIISRTESDVTAHEAALSISENQIYDLGNYITGYNVTESDVTAHEAALSITTSQISDFTSQTGNYITGYDVTESDVTAHEAALSISENQIYDLGNYITGYNVTESDVTAHEAALSISENQISDLGNYITGYNVTESDVTSHEAALSITTSQISDFTSHTHGINDLSDVIITSPQNEDVIKWNGVNFVNGQTSVDVETPLNIALRGTNNPHIGAYPNQSFKTIDNPKRSVMIVADDAGNLKLLNSLGVNNIAVGFSVVEDSAEPDIEVVSGGDTYSVISGDSDKKGANGLPTRQGFNKPDIGANPAPTLISGGSIS